MSIIQREYLATVILHDSSKHYKFTAKTKSAAYSAAVDFCTKNRSSQLATIHIVSYIPIIGARRTTTTTTTSTRTGKGSGKKNLKEKQ